jgi:hypothetical protein
MSLASEGIWFPIANNHRLHNQPADDIQPVSNQHETIPGQTNGNRKPSKPFPIANDHQPHNSIKDQTAHDIQPIINLQETPSGNRQTSIRPGYWFPFGSQVKADLVDGYMRGS